MRANGNGWFTRNNGQRVRFIRRRDDHRGCRHSPDCFFNCRRNGNDFHCFIKSDPVLQRGWVSGSRNRKCCCLYDDGDLLHDHTHKPGVHVGIDVFLWRFDRNRKLFIRDRGYQFNNVVDSNLVCR